MSKSTDIAELAKLLAPNDAKERSRLTAHHAKRSAKDVSESLQRQRAIAQTTQAEMRKHCQLNGLPTLGRSNKRKGTINFYQLGKDILASEITGIGE